MFRNTELLWLCAAVIGGLAVAIALVLVARPRPKTLGDLRQSDLERRFGADQAAGLRGVLVAADVTLDEVGLDPEEGRHWIQLDHEGGLFGLTLRNVPDLTSLERFDRLPGLRKLDIDGASLADLHGLAETNELWSLTITNSGLAQVDGLADSPQLQALDLSNNRLESLAGLPDLPRLRQLYASGNALQSTAGLGSRDRLEVLDLSGNQLGELTSLVDLPELQHLLVNGNQLTSLDELRGLPRLERILAEENQLVDARALDRFPNLKAINLAKNRIQRWPKVAQTVDPQFVRDNPTSPHDSIDREAIENEARLREQPHGVAESLPPIRATTRFSRGLRRWAGNRVWCDGGIRNLSGTARIVLRTFEPGGDLGDPAKRPATVRLSISAGKGRLRAYLSGSQGFPYIESNPGETATMTGELFVSDSAGVTFVLEPLDGSAEDISYNVEPAG